MTERNEHSPVDLEQGEFEAVGAFGAHAKVGKDKEPGVLAVVLAVFEMVERGDDRAGRASGLNRLATGVATVSPSQLTFPSFSKCSSSSVSTLARLANIK